MMSVLLLIVEQLRPASNYNLDSFNLDFDKFTKSLNEMKLHKHLDKLKIGRK
jgi:hypothetical protein